MPGRFSLYHDLTVEENLEFFAAIFGTTVKENYKLIAPIYEQIAPFRKRLAGKLSGGMKQKLALSCALVHKPRILILDEPTTGVDAVSRSEFWEMLSGLRSEGITILVSTPYMDEALKCDRVALIQSGKILGIDSPTNIQKDYKKNLFSAHHENKYKLLLTLKKIAQTTSLLSGDPQPFGDTVHITVAEEITTPEIIKVLESEGLLNVILKKISPGIEDVFLEKMKN